MATITLTDLTLNRALDVKAMSALRGAGGAWVIGAFRPFTEATPAMVPVVNYFQVNNNYLIVDTMINQFTNVEIANTGDNANLTTVLVNSLGG